MAVYLLKHSVAWTSLNHAYPSSTPVPLIFINLIRADRRCHERESGIRQTSVWNRLIQYWTVPRLSMTPILVDDPSTKPLQIRPHGSRHFRHLEYATPSCLRKNNPIRHVPARIFNLAIPNPSHYRKKQFAGDREGKRMKNLCTRRTMRTPNTVSSARHNRLVCRG